MPLYLHSFAVPRLASAISPEIAASFTSEAIFAIAPFAAILQLFPVTQTCGYEGGVGNHIRSAVLCSETSVIEDYRIFHRRWTTTEFSSKCESFLPALKLTSEVFMRREI